MVLDTLTGFTVLGFAILVGYVLARIDLLGEHGRLALSRLAFFVLGPFLIFVVISTADLRMLFSALLPASAIAAFSVIALYALIARVLWRRSFGETLIGSLSSGQVNSNNIGIPLSLYLLGNAAYPIPVSLMQLVLFIPVTLVLLDSVGSARSSLWRTLGRAVGNPIVVASALGIGVALSGSRCRRSSWSRSR